MRKINLCKILKNKIGFCPNKNRETEVEGDESSR